MVGWWWVYATTSVHVQVAVLATEREGGIEGGRESGKHYMNLVRMLTTARGTKRIKEGVAWWLS
jgi:hypothetical protein